MQTFSPGKHVRGFAQRHPHTQQLARCLGQGGLASSYLANKSKVLWMRGE